MKTSTKCLILAALIITGLVFAFMTPIKFLINFAHDDSFFYLKTAYNFSKGLGSTFDGVNITNGYHPLWFIILSAYFLLLNQFFTFSPDLYFRLVVIIHFAICAGILMLVFKIFKLRKENPEYLRQFFLFIPLFIVLVFTRDFGMESQLLCLIYSTYLYLKSKEVFQGKSFIIYKIILLNLLFLSRVDYLFSIIPSIIISDYLSSEKERIRFLVISCLTVFILSISYFTFNKMYYGYFLTVSGVLKNSFPDFVLFQNLKIIFLSPSLMFHFVKFLFIVYTILFSLLYFRKNKNKLNKIDIFLFYSTCGSILFIILNLSYNMQALREWYVTFPTFIGSLLFIFSLSFSEKRFYLKFGTLIILCLIYFYETRMNNFKWNSSYDYAISLKNVTNENDKIFQIDFSGAVGFFSERKLINGDGLINSFEYLDYLKQHNLRSYFSDKQINLYSTHSEENKFYKITDSLGYYVDKFYSNKFGGYPFTYPEKNKVFEMPFEYDHALYEARGHWYLFKIPE